MVEYRDNAVRKGSSRRSLLLAAGLAVVCPAAALAKKKEKAPEAVAIISVSVFREPGFSLPAAEIQLQPHPDSKPSIKVKTMKAVSDRRGETSFRVPAVPGRYSLSIRATGYQAETRQIVISGEERQDVFVTLKAARETSQ